MSLQGTDQSYWQKDRYQEFVDNYSKDFVIVRATFGRTVDSYCDKIYQYAKSKGKKLGFYMFPLTSEGDARASAEWHYSQVTGYIGEAIPCIDWEATNGTDVSNTEWCYQFAKRFEELSGVKPMIYMNQSCERSYNWSKLVENDNSLWIANYGPNDGQDHGVSGLKYWPFWAIHQYTSLLGGQSLDGDIFQGDAEAWDKYVGKSSGSKPAPAPAPAPKPEPKPSYIEHVVKPGETLSGIAAQYGTTYQKIAADNGIANPNLIYPNQVLKIYTNGAAPAAPAPSGKTYTVQPGDNLSSIAAKFGTTWQKIYDDNKGVIGGNPNVIMPGMVLTIK